MKNNRKQVIEQIESMYQSGIDWVAAQNNSTNYQSIVDCPHVKFLCNTFNKIPDQVVSDIIDKRINKKVS